MVARLSKSRLGWRAAVLVTAVSLLALAGCKDAASDGECQKALENVVDIEFSQAGTKAETAEQKAEVAKQKQATLDAVRTSFLEACRNKTPRKVVACTTAAKTAEDLAACDVGK